MNQFQVAQQIKYLLINRKWLGDDANSVVFGKVIISAKPVEDIIRQGPIFPIAIVRIGNQTHDDDFPEIVLDMGIDVEVVARVENDRFGESGFSGGARLSLTASPGRGIGEISTEVHATIKHNDNETGIALQSRNTNDSGLIQVANSSYFSRTIEVGNMGGVELFFHPARELANSGGVLSWLLPPDRFDRHSVVLRYASGSTAPASATDGSGATIATLATSYTHGDDGQGGGTFSYSLFGAYDYTGDGTIDLYSDPISITAAF